MLYANDRIYDWDETKRSLNLSRHGLDFEDVAEFDWGTSIPQRTDRGGEERFAATSMFRGKLHTIIYTERGALIRIISFRRANDKEEIRYAAA